MQEINADAYGVAALTLIQSIVMRLIEKRLMTREEALQMYQEIAQIKAAKGIKYSSQPEIDAAKLVTTMAVELEMRAEEGG
jgi:hypothetical protein